MLAGGALTSVPAIVADIDEYLRAGSGELTHFIGKDGFVADEGGEFVSFDLEPRAGVAGNIVADCLRQTAGKSEDAFERHVLAEGHQMDLVVMAKPGAIGSDEGDAVGLRRLAAGEMQRKLAYERHQDMGGLLPGQPADALAKSWVAFEKWRGRFRPDDEPRTITSGRGWQRADLRQLSERRLQRSRRPLFIKRDMLLHQQPRMRRSQRARVQEDSQLKHDGDCQRQRQEAATMRSRRKEGGCHPAIHQHDNE